MSEQNNEPVVASRGKVERVQFNMGGNNNTNPENQSTEEGTTGAANTGNEISDDKKKENIAAGLNEDGSPKTIEITPEKKAENIAAGLNEDGSPKNTGSQPLTDEEIKAEYERRFPPTVILTDEDKQKQAEAFEKRMLDLYVEGGGKIEEFALLKQVASSDLTELSKAELTRELKAMGITDESHIAVIQKERYYQKEQAEIDAIEDEDERALAQKKFDYGKAKFEGKGKQAKENATEFFNNLSEAVKQKDFFTQRENEISSNVEEHFSKVEKKMTLQLGKVDDTEIAPVEYDVPQEAIDRAKAMLNTPAARKQLLYNNDGSINHQKLADIVLKAEMFESAAKTAYLTGGTRQVEIFETTFPFRSATALGLQNGSTQNAGGTGKVASIGKNQRVKQAANQ